MKKASAVAEAQETGMGTYRKLNTQ